MTIDRAIKREQAKAEEYRAMSSEGNAEIAEIYIRCSKYHEQLAEWLEELKAIKSDGFTDNLLNMGFTKGYNKALDDIESEFLKCEKVHYNLQDILCVINRVKAGGENVQKK